MKTEIVRSFAAAVFALFTCVALCRGQTHTPTQILSTYPMAQTIEQLRARALAVDTERNTQLGKADYITLIAANVDFFKKHQNAAGAIIDPYERVEKQYSTPAFALDAAIAARELNRNDLLEPAIRAMSFSVNALANRTTADNHADFYIPLIIHARRILKDQVPQETLANWDRQLRSIVPETTYKETTGTMNWNVVNICGEALRRHDGLVANDQLEAQQRYLDKCFKLQLAHFTPMGMYTDPNVPMAYDAFPRLWMEDAMADRAYSGEETAGVVENLTRGGLSTLLLFSPTGEWISGGRSANHQWNEAQIAAIAECNAMRWKAEGNNVLAGMFKRVAHLAVQSMRRWQRPSGELWIVKNFADPANRHGYEGYSFHSQYNLLAMAMLAVAHERADDTIREQLIPSEFGQYVVDLRDPFHKVVAAAAGQYIVIDTAADWNFNATGLQRIHQRNTPLSPLSDSAAGNRTYGPANAPKLAISPGMQWKNLPTDTWHSLANDTVLGCDLESSTAPGLARFTLQYQLKSALVAIEQQWRIDASGVECFEQLKPISPIFATRFVFPAMVSDGAADTKIEIGNGSLSIERSGGALMLELLPLSNLKFALEGDRIATHNGFVRVAAVDLADAAKEVRWRAKLSPVPLAARQ